MHNLTPEQLLSSVLRVIRDTEAHPGPYKVETNSQLKVDFIIPSQQYRFFISIELRTGESVMELFFFICSATNVFFTLKMDNPHLCFHLSVIKENELFPYFLFAS